MSVLASYIALGVRSVYDPFEPIPESEKCDGSRALVHEDSLDGNFVGTCGTCKRFIVAEELVGSLRRVREHRPLRVVTYAGSAS